MLTLHFTDRAESHLEHLADWAENHQKSRRQVLKEVERATSMLCEMPSMGSLYESKRGRDVRRSRVGKTPYYLYYVVDADAETVSVLAIWSAMRRAGPDL